MNSRWHTIRERASLYSLCGAVITMPFSIALCHACLILFILLWMTENSWTEKIERIKDNYQLLVLITLGVVMFAGIFYSEDQDTAWFAMEKKLFFFLVPLAMATSAINSPHLLKILFRCFCFSCAIALVVCYVHAFRQIVLFEDGLIGTGSVNYFDSSDLWDSNTPKRWLFFSYVSLSGGIGMHPTYLALYCAFCCIILTNNLWRANDRLSKATSFLLLLFFSVSIIFLAARVIILMLGVVYIIMLSYELLVSKSPRKNAVVLITLIGLLIAGVTFNPVTRYRQVDEIQAVGISVNPDKHYTNSTGIRASLWWLSAKAYLHTNPIIGAGIGDVQHLVQAMGAKYHVTNILQSHDPHSQYLHLLLSSGIIGLGLFFTYVGIGFIKAWRSRDLLFLNFLILFSIVCITESALELQKGIVFFSIFFSSMTFLRTEPKSKNSLVNFANVGT